MGSLAGPARSRVGAVSGAGSVRSGVRSFIVAPPVSVSMRRSLHADHQGSIVAISTGSGGTLLTDNTYDAYGVRAEAVRCYDGRPDPTPRKT